MGNPLKKIEPWIDPIGNLGQKTIANATGLGADPKNPNTGLTAFNPNNAPGSHLTPAPAGGPPTSGQGMFSPMAGQAPPGYAPNPAQSGAGYSPPTGSPPPGGPPLGAAPGGMPPGGAPAGLQQRTGGMNPQLQRQLMMAQMLRGGGQVPPPMSQPGTSIGGGSTY
jgi:hypothetical protein